MTREEALELIGICISTEEMDEYNNEQYLKRLRDLRKYILENLK